MRSLTNMREERLQGGSAAGNAHDHPHHGIVGRLMVDDRDEAKPIEQQH